jgi:hypothetical protein
VRRFDVNQNILEFERLLETEVHLTERVRALHLLLREIDKVDHYSLVHLIELNGKWRGTKNSNLLQTMIQTQALLKLRRERIARELRT